MNLCTTPLLLLLLFFGQQMIGASYDAQGRLTPLPAIKRIALIQDVPNSPNVRRVTVLRGEVARLVKLKEDAPNVWNKLPLELKESALQASRMNKCLQVFRSRQICQNNVPFYLWAQVLAKEILSGKHDHDDNDTF